MKVRKSQLLFLGLIVLLVFEYHFWHLIEFGNTIEVLFNKNARVGVGIISLALWLFTLNKKTTKYIDRYCLYCVFAFVCIAAFSYIRLPSQPFYSVLEATSMILVLLLIKPFYIILKRDDEIDSIMIWVNVVVLIWCIVIFVQNKAYLNGDELLLKNFFANSNIYISSRSDNVRMQLQSLGNIIPIYNAYKLMTLEKYPKERRKFVFIINLISLILILYCAVVIAQTRAFILVVIGAIVMMVLEKRGRTKKQLVTVSTIVIAVAIAFASGVFDSFFDSLFNKDNISSISMLYRLEELRECLLYFFNNPILGNGFFSGQYYNYFYGSSVGTIWTNDVGIVGLLAGGGIIAGMLFIWPLYHAIKEYKKNGNNSDKILYSGFLMYLIAVSITMMMTDPKVIFAFPLMFAIFEYSAQLNDYDCYIKR